LKISADAVRIAHVDLGGQRNHCPAHHAVVRGPYSCHRQPPPSPPHRPGDGWETEKASPGTRLLFNRDQHFGTEPANVEARSDEYQICSNLCRERASDDQLVWPAPSNWRPAAAWGWT
jgi:hypothetical protein